MFAEEAADPQVVLMKATKLLQSEFDFTSITIQVECLKDGRWRSWTVRWTRSLMMRLWLLLPHSLRIFTFLNTQFVALFTSLKYRERLQPSHILLTGNSCKEYSSAYIQSVSLWSNIYSCCYNLKVCALFINLGKETRTLKVGCFFYPSHPNTIFMWL